MPPKGRRCLPARSRFSAMARSSARPVPFTNPGAEIDLGFGVDDNVKVVRTELERATGEHGILSSRKTDLRRFKITVENLHGRPIESLSSTASPTPRMTTSPLSTSTTRPRRRQPTSTTSAAWSPGNTPTSPAKRATS